MIKHEPNFEQPESMQQPMITHHYNLKMKPNSASSKPDYDSYVLLKYSPIKIIFTAFLSLVTGFLIWIPILKSDSFKKWILYEEIDWLMMATHVYIKQDRQTQLHQSFQFKKVIYLFDGQTPVRYRFKPINSKYFSQQRQDFLNQGLNLEQEQQQRSKFGKCQHVFQVPGLGLFLIDTLTGPFFILQYFTCLVYIWETFYVFAAIMLGTSLVTTFINYYLLRRSVMKIKESTQKYTSVQILRNGQFAEVNSHEIVPGDIIKPPKNMPCDALLIQGGVFVNESTLTGESLPIQKTIIESQSQLLDEKHWLYQGSIVVEERGSPLALVIETGFNTRKGQSFRTMLDHDYEQPRFVRSGFLFMVQLLIICCIIFGIMIPVMVYKKLQSRLIIMRFLDMLGWAIPPTFPIFFNICYSFTLYRLQKKKIFATEPTKTVTAGKVKNIYFDKTGTLTLNKIQFSKVTLFIEDGSPKQLDIYSTILDPQQISTKIFSSCHSARVIQNELMGDEVDIRMFEKSGYHFEVSQDTKIKAVYKSGENCIEAIRINQYESQNRSMSVLIKDVKSGQYYVVVKGSPEKLAECSINQIRGYDDIVFKMSLQGLRLIAYGFKKVDNEEDYLNGDIKMFQTNLTLMGLMGFSNQLRPESIQTISILKDSGINIAMITGDNIWTGIEAATRTGIINKEEQVLVFEGNKQNQEQNVTTFKGLVLSNKSKQINQLKQLTISFDQFNNSKYTLAVDSNFLNLFPDLINSSIKVFARSKPQTKLHIVTTIQNRLQQQYQNKSFFTRLISRTPYAVAMVGDGANDVMAIKGANVGIGINDCDSSFASDYSIDKLTDVEYVLRSGKTTLSIVLDMFRYYGSISILKFTTTCIMSLDRANYSDNQFTYFNYMQSIEIVVLMSLTLPIKERTIYYPNDNLLSLENHLIFHGMIILPTLALFIIYQIASHLPGYILNPQQQYYTWSFKCMTNTVLSLASQCFYVSNAFIIYTAFPWKPEIWKNKALIAWLTISAISLAIYFFITEKLDTFFGYVYIPQMALIVTISIVLGFIGLEYVWKRVIRCFKLELSQ